MDITSLFRNTVLTLNLVRIFYHPKSVYSPYPFWKRYYSQRIIPYNIFDWTYLLIWLHPFNPGLMTNETYVSSCQRYSTSINF